ncbi:hypothetical protein GCM10010492_04350 [Saccharothrix mutabilis subsp. mutabilis]|uniref:Uncharacterized protein n=1 Tax=Saccharothrix mutabilis subsp. mutabilis TaxID=66855 RepID=A0ABN0T246_9PSEU
MDFFIVSLQDQPPPPDRVRRQPSVRKRFQGVISRTVAAMSLAFAVLATVGAVTTDYWSVNSVTESGSAQGA